MGQESSQIQGAEEAPKAMDINSNAEEGQDEAALVNQILARDTNRKTRKKKRNSSTRLERDANDDNAEDNPEDQVDDVDQRRNQKLRKALKKKSKSKEEGEGIEEKPSKSKKHKHGKSESTENAPQSTNQFSSPDATEQTEAQQSEEAAALARSSKDLENSDSIERSAPEVLIPDDTEVVRESSVPFPDILPSSSASLGSKKKKKKTKLKHRISQSDIIADVDSQADLKVESPMVDVEQTQIPNSYEVAPSSSYKLNATRIEETNYDNDVDMAEVNNMQDTLEVVTIEEVMEEVDPRAHINTIVPIDGRTEENQQTDATQLLNIHQAPTTDEEMPKIGADLGGKPTTKARKPKRRLPVEDDAVDTPSKKARKSLKVKTPTSRRKDTRDEATSSQPSKPSVSPSKVKTPTSKHKNTRAEATSSQPLKPSVSPSKTPRGKAGTENATHSGKFDDAELAIIKNQLLKHREMVNLSEEDQNSLIHGNVGVAQEMFSMVCEELPGRARWAVIKFCRRKFHNFQARGRWASDDDEELKEAYKLFPKRWTQIAQRLNRHPEDCRDRWRNYLICGDSMKSDNWDVDEEHKLREVVAECISLVRELKRNDMLKFDGDDRAKYLEDSPADIDLVDWQQVSEKMGRTRSRLQCSQKWKRILDREDADKGDAKPIVVNGQSWRERDARLDTQTMHSDDKLKILHAIRESQVGREGKIKWGKLGDAAFQSRWKTMSRRVAFMRLKASLPDADCYKLQELVTILIDKFENSRGKDPTGDSFQETETLNNKKKRHLSTARVRPEDDEDGEVDETPQPRGMSEELGIPLAVEVNAADDAVEDEVMQELPKIRKSRKLNRPSLKKKKLSNRMARRSKSFDDNGNPAMSDPPEVPESVLGDQYDAPITNGHSTVADGEKRGRSIFSNDDEDPNGRKSIFTLDNGAANGVHRKPDSDSELDFDRDEEIPARRPVAA